MDNNWIVENLTNAFGVWNSKMTEMWSLLTESPQTFKGGTIWQTIVTINGGMQAIGYGLLVLFFAIGIFRSASSFRDFQRPEHLLRHFIYFVLAKLGITYGMDLLVDVFDVCSGIVATAAGSIGGLTGASVALPQEIADAIGDVGFFASIPLWLVTLLGSLFITVLAFIMILTVYSGKDGETGVSEGSVLYAEVSHAFMSGKGYKQFIRRRIIFHMEAHQGVTGQPLHEFHGQLRNFKFLFSV